MKTLFLSASLIFCMAMSSVVSAQTTMVTVVFQDGKYYKAKLLEETESTIKVEFIPSHTVYFFDNTGRILSSTGKYATGNYVKLISVHDYIEDVYYRENLTYEYQFAGVLFSDNQLYFGLLEANGGNTCTVFFDHSGSTYQFEKVDGTWRVAFTDKGKYPVGCSLAGLFTVENFGREFFSDRSLDYSKPEETFSTDTNN